jgi:hypothetical protein
MEVARAPRPWAKWFEVDDVCGVKNQVSLLGFSKSIHVR